MTLAVIPARSGSKRLPNKNFREFLGYPLFRWTIDQVRISGCIDDFVVTTDREEIQSTKVIPRPPMLATDKASTVDTVIHAVWEYNLRYNIIPDLIVLLQPTGVARTREMISTCIRKKHCYTATNGKPNGGVYVVPWKVLEKTRQFGGKPIERPCIDIDTLKDFKKAEEEVRGKSF